MCIFPLHFRFAQRNKSTIQKKLNRKAKKEKKENRLKKKQNNWIYFLDRDKKTYVFSLVSRGCTKRYHRIVKGNHVWKISMQFSVAWIIEREETKQWNSEREKRTEAVRKTNMK